MDYILKLFTILRWSEVELNHRHTDFQSVALPTELSGLFLQVRLNVSTGVFCEFLKQGWCRSGEMNIHSHTNHPTPHFP